MFALEVQSLHKTFVRGFFRRKTVALNGISFAVERGEVFGFLGPNGAGKTTTIKILMGLIHASSGDARVLGEPAGTRVAKQRVGYLPETPYFYDYLSVHELLDMVARLHGLDRSTRKRRGESLVERVGLSHAGRRPLRSFSKGMLQRAGLAQALMADPDIIVLDEPMSGLDPIGRKQVRELILEQKHRGKTIFFSTHILGDASLMCDRVGIIVGGHIRDVGPLGALLDPAVHAIEVIWQVAGEQSAAKLRAIEGHHTQTSEGRIYRTDDPQQAQQFVASVVAEDGQVLQLVRHRQSLEELFVDEAGASAEQRRARRRP